MAVRERLDEGHAGAPSLYLLFAGRHGDSIRGMGTLVAAFASPDDARAAFRQARLRLSDRDGWAELTVVADGSRPKRLSWFGAERHPTDRPPTWLLAGDTGGQPADDRGRVFSRRSWRRVR